MFRNGCFLQVHTAQQPQVHKYTTSAVQEKCLLKVEDSRLFRLVELVRINLHFRTDEATALAYCWGQWLFRSARHLHTIECQKRRDVAPKSITSSGAPWSSMILLWSSVIILVMILVLPIASSRFQKGFSPHPLAAPLGTVIRRAISSSFASSRRWQLVVSCENGTSPWRWCFATTSTASGNKRLGDHSSCRFCERLPNRIRTIQSNNLR